MFYNISYFFVIVILWFKCRIHCETSDGFAIGFLIDSTQTYLEQDISSIIEELDTKITNKINDNYVIIDYNNIDETIQQICKAIFQPQSIFIDLSYYTWEDGLQYIKASKIPYLRVDISLNQFIKALEDFLIVREANDACLIFESEYHLDDAIYYMVSKNSELRLGLLNGMENNFIEKFKNMRPSPSYYGIFATTQNMNIILDKLIVSKLFKRPDKWHLVFLNGKIENLNMKKYDDELTRVSVQREFACKVTENKKNCDLLENFSQFQSTTLSEILLTIFNQINNINLDIKSINCDEHPNDFFNLVNDDLIDISHLFMDNNKLKNEDGTITYFLNLSFSKLTEYENIKAIALWDSSEQITNISPVIKPAKRFFRIGTTEAIPWSYYKRNSKTDEIILDDERKPIWEGYCIDFIQKLSEKLNFDYEIISPKHGTFGERQPDGSWDGVVGDLVYGYTDMAISALKMTSEREEVIDFIAPYFEQTGISIVIRKPVRQTSLFKFMTVLRTEVWFSIVAALIATAIMIWLLDKYSPYSAANNRKAYSYPCREFTLKESFWFALTSFTPQGGGEAPKALSGRVLVASYWLFVVLMLATFTANLAAFLTVERMQTPVQSLEQLARQSRINYTVVMNSDTHEYFINMKHAEDTLYRMWKELTLNATADQRKYRIWDYPIKEQYGHILLAINSSNPVKNAKEGFRKVDEHENADYAFIHDSAEIKYEITRNCNLTEVGEVFAEQPYAIAVQQGSHIQDELSYAILELQKDRYFEGLNAKFWNSSARRECSASEESEGITLESLGGVFIATLFGLALAMITLVIEVIYYRTKSKTSRKIKPVHPTIIPEKNIFFRKNIEVTPPPSFEKAVYNSKKVPQHITLGSQNFKPTRLRKHGGFSTMSSNKHNKFEDSLSYYE